METIPGTALGEIRYTSNASLRRDCAFGNFSSQDRISSGIPNEEIP
jgi:hypothetical protein